jgi:hypothetical protein
MRRKPPVLCAIARVRFRIARVESDWSETLAILRRATRQRFRRRPLPPGTAPLWEVAR